MNENKIGADGARQLAQVFPRSHLACSSVHGAVRLPGLRRQHATCCPASGIYMSNDSMRCAALTSDFTLRLPPGARSVRLADLLGRGLEPDRRRGGQVDGGPAPGVQLAAERDPGRKLHRSPGHHGAQQGLARVSVRACVLCFAFPATVLAHAAILDTSDPTTDAPRVPGPARRF
eukprot:2061808-Rhodomonas_salina.2